MLRKMIVATLLLLLVGSFSVWAETTYEIETKYGVEQLIIPDGYTVEDVLLIVAKNYYELDHEHDELLSKVDSLESSVKDYIEMNRKLREEYAKIIVDYDKLIKDLEGYARLSNFQGFVGAGGTYDFKKNFGLELELGMLLFNKFLLSVEVNFPFTLGLSVGFIF